MARYSIYYLYDRTNPSEKYIGQGSRSNYITRPLEHFSGLYHFKQGGSYATSTGNKAMEGAAFINWLHYTCLQNVKCIIWDWSNQFGISDNDWIAFASQWAPEEIFNDVQTKSIEVAEGKHSFTTFKDVLWLWGSGNYLADAAEIMHIYKSSASGAQLMQIQMGGQSEVWRNLTNNSVLNRDMSPSAMSSVLNSAHMKEIQSVQEAFNTSLQRQIKKSDKFLSKLKNALMTEENLYIAVKNTIEDFLKEVNQKQTILQTIIRDVQNECEVHLVDFGLQFPKGHADLDAIDITFNTKGVQTLEKAITNTILSKKQDLEKKLSENLSLKTLADWLVDNVVGKISIGTFIKVNLKNITSSTISLSINPGTDYSAQLVPHLKRMSYWYYMHFANQYFSEAEQLSSNSSYDVDDMGFGKFFRVFGNPSCTNYIWQKYREEGISNYFTNSYGMWLQFNRGMLTCYTKNNGNNWFEGKLTPTVLQKNIEEELSNPILASYFDVEVEEQGYPFYKFSQTTWEYINTHFNDNIEDLVYY